MSSISITPPPGEPGRRSSGSESGAASAHASPASLVAASMEIVAHEGVSRAVGIRVVKRSFDIVVSAVLLLLLLPVLVIIAVLIRLDSPGPVVFRCERAGYRGRRIRLLKFRKMACDAQGGPPTTAEDARFTRLGRRLPKSKLDE